MERRERQSEETRLALAEQRAIREADLERRQRWIDRRILDGIVPAEDIARTFHVEIEAVYTRASELGVRLPSALECFGLDPA